MPDCLRRPAVLQFTEIDRVRIVCPKCKSSVEMSLRVACRESKNMDKCLICKEDMTRLVGADAKPEKNPLLQALEAIQKLKTVLTGKSEEAEETEKEEKAEKVEVSLILPEQEKHIETIN